MKFVLRTSKTHWKDKAPQIVIIQSTQCTGLDKTEFCPFNTLKSFLAICPKSKTTSEFFFIFHDGTPIRTHNVQKVLKEALHTSGFRSKLYSFHSLRSGRACDLLALGVSVETIKKLGHWKSNAVYNYLS